MVVLNHLWSPGRVAQLVGVLSVQQKGVGSVLGQVDGLIPIQGAYGSQLMDVSLSLQYFSLLSLSPSLSHQ